jgi:intracellular sulfur oxidation DsrE/DsrF family protein
MKKSLLAMGLTLAALSASAAEYKLAIQVSDNDPQKMNIALNNAQNVQKHYEASGDSVAVEIVAYGPGLQMYTMNSPVKDRIDALSLDESYTFAACGNTLAKMEKKAGKKVALLDGSTMVSSGVVRLMELQSQGYAYVRP